MESTGGDSAIGVSGMGYNVFISWIERNGCDWVCDISVGQCQNVPLARGDVERWGGGGCLR
jgi:hypothetical protein